MARYSIHNSSNATPAQQVMTTSYKTLITTLSSATVRRIKLYDVAWGTNGTPSDHNLEVDISRQTAADGTAVSSTALPLDPADAAALTVCKINYTVEGTVTAVSSILDLPTNVRASYRWVAFPGGELVGPATSAAGFAIRAKSPSGYALTVGAMAYFEEQ